MNPDKQFLADLHIRPERIREPQFRVGYERTEISVNSMTLDDGNKIVLMSQETFDALSETNERLAIEYEHRHTWRALLWTGWITAGCLLALCVWLVNSWATACR